MSTRTPIADGAAPAEVARYVDDVAAHLASLAWLSEADRAELLDDLAQHLTEVVAEESSPLAERLGPSTAYAEELVAAAGLEPPAAPAAQLLTAAGLRTALAAGWDRLQRTVEEVGDLRPAWWILRGYLAASLLGVVTGSGHTSGHPGFPIPAVLGSRVVGVLAVVAAVKLSLRWGRQGRPARRWVSRAVGAGFGVYAMVLLASLGTGRGDLQWVESTTPIGHPSCLVNGDGQVIENLYPYDAQGRLLGEVLLYDQTGRPLDNLCPRDYDDQGRTIVTEYGQDANGAPVINLFPRRQTRSASPPMEAQPDPFGAPTTSPSPRPVNPPAVVVPRLATTTTTAAPPATTSTTVVAETSTTSAVPQPPSPPTSIGG